ncbi:hypothetical protein [Microbacterium sp. zg-YB36]|uniref:hypothetical protein n=1 Tax=Microbacterium sp. zg-YB36 TaxID=2969407 RepID=UPI00214BF8E3|nr:hypothetical protein [Microbacterium sp. zg-YB36]MDL5350561.1 hypothetical protein [Microbacterium sp. zg-YB36]
MNLTEMTRIAHIDRIVAAGGTVTKEYDRLTDRLDQFANVENDLLERLTEAVITDAPLSTIADLRAMAVAQEATNLVHAATVRNAVEAVVHKAMSVEYAKTAVANYNTFRDEFNKHADALTAAHKIVPATADPATLVTAANKVRQAWADGQNATLALTATMPLLILAAELAGTSITNPTAPIGLVADVNGLHRRRVWEAFEQGWTALVELGATLRAPELHEYEEYREPLPIEIQHEQVGRGTWRNVEVDPEDAGATLTARERIIL